MRLLAWNIHHGGGKRAPRIVEEVAAYDPDVVAVTEYRAGPDSIVPATMSQRGRAVAGGLGTGRTRVLLTSL